MITIEDIKVQYAKVAEMIATFEAQANTRTIEIGAQSIILQAGERYAGMILDQEGNPLYHLISMAEEVKGVNWQDSMLWAETLGGELPTRQEQALLCANLKGQFKSEYYWSNTQHAATSHHAWSQSFHDGHQYSGYKSAEFRARPVRRVPFQGVE